MAARDEVPHDRSREKLTVGVGSCGDERMHSEVLPDEARDRAAVSRRSVSTLDHATEGARSIDVAQELEPSQFDQ